MKMLRKDFFNINLYDATLGLVYFINIVNLRIGKINICKNKYKRLKILVREKGMFFFLLNLSMKSKISAEFKCII